MSGETLKWEPGNNGDSYTATTGDAVLFAGRIFAGQWRFSVWKAGRLLGQSDICGSSAEARRMAERAFSEDRLAQVEADLVEARRAFNCQAECGCCGRCLYESLLKSTEAERRATHAALQEAAHLLRCLVVAHQDRDQEAVDQVAEEAERWMGRREMDAEASR